MMEGIIPFVKANIERSIPSLFESQVCQRTDNIAVGCGQESITFGELNCKSNRIAHGILQRLGEHEEPIALLLRQGTPSIEAILGSLKAGKIFVPLEPSLPYRELERIINSCHPRLIIADHDFKTLAQKLISDSAQYFDPDSLSAGESEDNPNLVITPDRVCYIFFTSGTTGPPKGVFDNHRNVLHNIMRYTNSLKINTSDRLSLIQSCSFSGTVSSLFSGLLNGAVVCPFDLTNLGISRLASWIEREKISIFHSTPSIFEQIMSTGHLFDSLRIIRLEGDRAMPRQISIFQSHFKNDCILVNGLGLTEAGIVRQYFVTPKSELDNNTVPVGNAVEDMEIEIVDDHGKKLKPGNVGEIVVRSKYLALGYWNRPELTESSFLIDPQQKSLRRYHSRDLGRLREDGILEYLGRQDLQQKVRGQWIDIGEIENSLLTIETIDQTLVTVNDDGLGSQQLVAYLVSSGVRPTVECIRRNLRSLLPVSMIPSKYIFLDSIPLDRNGKIDRRKLPKPKQQRPILETKYVAPRNYQEEVIAGCIRSVLKLEKVGVFDRFMDLGGDSLLATELLLQIEDRLGLDNPLAYHDQNMSVDSIMSILNRGHPDSSLIKLQDGDSRAPLFCIHSYSGVVLGYNRLATYLGSDRTVYGIQSRAFTNAGRQDKSVEDMARAYAKEIIDLETRGPYYLCGNCFGGTIAFEIAQQLRKQDREVALLAMIDTVFPAGTLKYLTYRILDPYLRSRFLNLPISNWPQYFAHEFHRFVQWIIREGRRRMSSIPSGDKQLSVLDQNILAQARYKPQPYYGDIVIFSPGPPYNQRGWMSIAESGYRIIEIPLVGNPEKSPHLIDEPYVETLAKHILEYLDP